MASAGGIGSLDEMGERRFIPQRCGAARALLPWAGKGETVQTHLARDQSDKISDGTVKKRATGMLAMNLISSPVSTPKRAEAPFCNRIPCPRVRTRRSG